LMGALSAVAYDYCSFFVYSIVNFSLFIVLL